MTTGNAPSVRFGAPDTEAVRAMASLRWDWALERGHEPTRSRDAFIDEFVRWCADNAATHRCIVGFDDADALIAFGFVAIVERVPAGHALHRRTADLQSVYVAPGARNSGVGGLLIDRLVGLCRDAGVEHITVHASARAVTAYERAGFSLDPQMLYLAP